MEITFHHKFLAYLASDNVFFPTNLWNFVFFVACLFGLSSQNTPINIGVPSFILLYPTALFEFLHFMMRLFNLIFFIFYFYLIYFASAGTSTGGDGNVANNPRWVLSFNFRKFLRVSKMEKKMKISFFLSFRNIFPNLQCSLLNAQNNQLY